MSHPKHARPDHQILDVIRHRWSPRAFDPDRAVARTDLMRLFEASRWAPSSRNEQPWRFVVADRHESPEAFAAFAGTLKGKNADWATAASAIVLVAVRTTLESDESENRSAMYDTGQAVGFLTLQATAMGLAVRQMAAFDRARVGEIAGVPEPFAPVVMMAVGYVGDPASLTDRAHRESEGQPRVRRPTGDFVFDSKWGRRLTSA